ncbi:MAG: hypothetical protein AABZ30_10080 [Myxococcota bacterium]|mgnify:CR=1 FL=1
MPLKRRTARGDGESHGPSRAEIEILCILHAVGPRGCPVGELAMRLGLSPALASAVAEGAQALVSTGWLELDDEQLALTDAGRARLTQRLSDLGVA